MSEVGGLKVSLAELADNFIRVGQDFIDIHSTRSLNESNLDFNEGSIVELNSCGTVSCHGGWGLILYGTEDQIEAGDFEDGAGLIEEQLGFENSEGVYLEDFAYYHKDFWGNEFGSCMFGPTGWKSFNKTKPCSTTLEDIGLWYQGVGGRIKDYIKEEEA